MLGRYAKPIVLALFAIWVMGFAYQVGRSSQQQEYRKKIEATYKASESIDGQGGSHRTNSRPHQPSAPQTSEGRHETPEIAFVGIKLGEALLVMVTIWLVFATRDLVGGTRDLVKGAENTAERQLRAYLIVEGTSCEPKPGRFISHFRIENTGQTPAHKTHVISRTCILYHPLKRGFDFSLLDQPYPSATLVGPHKDFTSASWLN